MTSPAGVYQEISDGAVKELFRQHYEDAFNGSWANRLGTMTTSDEAVETYGWLGAAPTLEELKGEIASEGFDQFSFDIRNREYSKSIYIKDKDRRRDKFDQLSVRMQEAAQKASRHWNTLVSDVISSNSNAYDGVSLFSGSHAESGTNQDNDLASGDVSQLDVGTAAAPTADEMADIIPAVLGKFYELTDDKGDEINGEARNFVLMAPTSQIWSAMVHATNADRLSSGETNVVTGGLASEGVSMTVILNPLLKSNTTKFWMFRADSPVRPFILQEEVPLDVQMSTRQNDEFINHRRFIFNMYASRAAAPGRWQSAMQCTLS